MRTESVRPEVWPEILSYSGITVYPLTGLFEGPRAGMRGGPAWPDWAREPRGRLFNGRLTQDLPAQPQAASAQVGGDRPCFWIGPIVDHFGHVVAEFASRIPPTLAACPDAVLVFTALRGSPFMSLIRTPAFFRELLDWYDIPAHRVIIVSEPTRFETLRVVPQPETLGEQFPGDPRPDYLAWLDAWARPRVSTGPRRGTVFVTRSGQTSRFCGEAWLDSAFRSAGIRVFRPETASLSEQVRTYAEAEMLVFSEGSAMHGAQLLGGVGRVVVLSRRQGSRLARSQLTPRAISLDYLDVCHAMIAGYYPASMRGMARVVQDARGISLLDRDALLAGLSAHGIDLAPHWDEAAFRRAEAADLKDMIRRRARKMIARNPGSFELLIRTLLNSGLEAAREEALWLLAVHLPGRGWTGRTGAWRQRACRAYLGRFTSLPGVGAWRLALGGHALLRALRFGSAQLDPSRAAESERIGAAGR